MNMSKYKVGKTETFVKILTLKKTPRDTIILHICTINDNYMLYGSWDMEHNRYDFLSFWNVFCPFTLLWTQKIKILKKWKKNPRCNIILHTCTINDNHIKIRKIKILKNWKKTWRYYNFTQVYQKSWSYAMLFLGYGAWRM